jgi:hypothetical protein
LYTFSIEFYPNQKKDVEITGKISFMLSNKVWFSLHQLPVTSKLLNGIMWKYLISNFTKIDAEILKLRP